MLSSIWKLQSFILKVLDKTVQLWIKTFKQFKYLVSYKKCWFYLVHHIFESINIFSIHTAWIWVWMTKIPCATSDNGFILKKMYKNYKRKEKKKSCGRFWRAAQTGHGQSSQLADFWKIAKMALFNPCMKFEIFRAKLLHLKWLMIIVLSELYS